MKTVAALRDLEQFGIMVLTGEADNLSYRVLCDLTHRGARIVTETYGLIGESAFQPSWNRGVGSVMLPYDAWKDIGIIGLLDSGCHSVIATEVGLFGLESNESYTPAEYDWEVEPPNLIRHAELTIDGKTMTWPRIYGKVLRIFKYGNHPHEGSRNVHQFTGRSK